MFGGEIFSYPAGLGAIGIFFVGIYVLVLLFLALAWYRWRPVFSDATKQKTPFVSVVFPFRNEMGSLPDLMSALQQQVVPVGSFEVLAVNDHSLDGGLEWLSEQTIFKGQLLLLNARGYGKKNALKEGIHAAKGPLIVTIDADCLPRPGWLSALIKFYQQSGADMLIGPVNMRSDGTPLGDFESVDYYALQMSAASAAMLGMPVFCSGANLAFKKEVWLKAVPKMAGSDKASGDDVFLLHAFKKLGKKIVFVRDSEAIVDTVTSGSVKAFFRQRMRWGGKSTAYKDVTTIVLAIVVFLGNLALLGLLVLWLFGDLSAWFFVSAFFVKAGTDFLLLFQGRVFFGLAYSFLSHLFYSMAYPFVLVALAIGGMLFPERWK